MLSPSSLKHLLLRCVNLTTSSFERLKENRNITALDFRFVSMGTKTISCIAEVLHDNTTLEELRFGLTSCSSAGIQDGLRDLSRALKVKRSLKVLRAGEIGGSDGTLLSGGTLPRDEVRDLVGALQYNQTLKRLELPRHCQRYFSREERTAMGNHVVFVN